MSDNIKFANQFIDLWQENFEKMLSSGENMRQMQQVLESLKGFYAKSESSDKSQVEPTPATDSAAHGDGDIAELVRTLSRRVNELEGRLADIERNNC